jgi:hypothetical protein
MKLNLLPTYVSKGKQAQVAIVFAILIVIACGTATVAMMSKSKAELEKWTRKAEEAKPAAEAVVTVSQLADTVIKNSTGVILDASLAKAMQDHNTVYPDFYDKLFPYIPSFFRVTSITATPIDDKTAGVTISGVIKSQEQYAALMLVFNRIPQVQTVTRTGYKISEQYIPSLTDVDQAGRLIDRGGQHIPDNPVDRMNYFISRGSLSGYTGSGGFGSGQPGLKGPMPEWSQISIALVMPGKLQTPNPKETLQAGGSSGSSLASSPSGGKIGMSGPMSTGAGGPMQAK